jgi:hypothetical protein
VDGIEIRSGGTPGDDEIAAIVAAVEAMWPRPVVAAADEGGASVMAWRFSGRWWARPLTARRERPWVAGRRP